MLHQHNVIIIIIISQDILPCCPYPICGVVLVLGLAAGLSWVKEVVMYSSRLIMSTCLLARGPMDMLEASSCPTFSLSCWDNDFYISGGEKD